MEVSPEIFSETRAPCGPWGRRDLVAEILAIQPVKYPLYWLSYPGTWEVILNEITGPPSVSHKDASWNWIKRREYERHKQGRRRCFRRTRPLQTWTFMSVLGSIFQSFLRANGIRTRPHYLFHVLYKDVTSEHTVCSRYTIKLNNLVWASNTTALWTTFKGKVAW